MPGLIGYARKEAGPAAALEAMAQRLEPESRFQRDLYAEDCVGLGRVHLRILNPAPQPVWNAARNVALVMDEVQSGFGLGGRV